MNNVIKRKNLIAAISVMAWGLALFFSANLASADTNMTNQNLTAGWYETDDALPAIQNHKTEKMMKHSENVQVTTGTDLISSWYETDDALPYFGTQNSRAMAQKAPAENIVTNPNVSSLDPAAKM